MCAMCRGFDPRISEGHHFWFWVWLSLDNGFFYLLQIIKKNRCQGSDFRGLNSYFGFPSVRILKFLVLLYRKYKRPELIEDINT